MYFLLFLTMMVIVAGPQLRELLKWPRPLPLEDERVRLLHEVKVSLIVLRFQIFGRLAFVFRNLVIDVVLYMYLHAPLLRYKFLRGGFHAIDLLSSLPTICNLSMVAKCFCVLYFSHGYFNGLGWF